MADNIDPNAAKPLKPDPTTEEVSEAKSELREAIHSSQELLVSANTVFPMTLIPGTIAVDREKISITNRTFFRVAEVISIRIEDVLNVTAKVGPFFGSIHIVSRIFSPDRPYEVHHLWRDDALRIKRIVQGYIISRQKEIETEPLSTKELAKMLDELGKDDHQ